MGGRIWPIGRSLDTPVVDYCYLPVRFCTSYFLKSYFLCHTFYVILPQVILSTSYFLKSYFLHHTSSSHTFYLILPTSYFLKSYFLCHAFYVILPASCFLCHASSSLKFFREEEVIVRPRPTTDSESKADSNIWVCRGQCGWDPLLSCEVNL